MVKIPNIEQGPISVDTIYDLIGSALNIPSVAMGQPTQFVVLNEVDLQRSRYNYYYYRGYYQASKKYTEADPDASQQNQQGN